MKRDQQQAILTLALLAAFADGANDDREREQIRRLADPLGGESGASFGIHDAWSAMTNLIKSAFSAEVHMRPNTSLQLRLNHFSTLAGSLKRSGVIADERAAMGSPVMA